jgi:hypothetical protein
VFEQIVEAEARAAHIGAIKLLGRLLHLQSTIIKINV